MQLLLQIQDTAILLSTLTALCFSFCILVMTIWFRDADKQSKIYGASFIPVFLFHAAALLLNHDTLSVIFMQTAEPMLMLLFTILLLGKLNKKFVVSSHIAIVMAPAIILLGIIVSDKVRDILLSRTLCLSILIVLSLLILYLIRKSKELDLVFKAVFILLVSAFLQYYLWQSLFIIASPVLKIIAYTVFLRFFYQVYLQSILTTSVENNKKLSELNRSIEFEVKKRMLEIEKVNQKLVHISKTDAMSQVLNKTALMESIDKLITQKSKSECSVLMLDIDNFKDINDTYGHVIGDKCIKELSSTLRNSLRDVDLIGRYGGDEFAVVLPGTGAKQAILIAERFRKRVEMSHSPHYTISIGIASYPSDANTVKELVEVADKGLYISKQKGRNAVSHLNFY